MIPDAIRFLAKAGQQAPSADNSQPWRLLWDGERLTLCYDGARVAGRTFGPEAPATLLAMGGVMENLDQAAAALEAELVWEPLKRGLDGICYGRALLLGNPKISEKPTATSLFQRHTNRFAYRPDSIPSTIVAFLQGECIGQAHARLYQGRETLAGVAGLVRRASGIRFRTREVHEWLAESLRFGREEVARGDGLDVTTLDLPPGGALFMRYIQEWDHMRRLNHLGAYRLMASVDARPVGRGPAMLAITAPPGRQPGLDAGRLLVRLWNRLNESGLAVHPYYVISDQLQRLADGRVPESLQQEARALARDSAELFATPEGERLYMLLRIGVPGRQPVRSRRLPLDAVFEDRSQQA